MKHTLKRWLGALAVALCVSDLAGADTTIVVHFAPHESPESAAASESQVDWLDADTRDDIVCTECFAAVELQQYLRQMTGREEDFRIVADDELPDGDLILVGGLTSNAAARTLAGQFGVEEANKQTTELGGESYRLKTVTFDGRRVTLAAGRGRVGTLYAVYDMLFRMGCRWFAPGAMNEEVPQVEWKPDFDVIEQPAFGNRGFFAWEDRGNAEFLLWMARNRLNYWCVEQSDHPLMRKLGIRMAWGEHQPQAMFINPAAEYPYNHASFQGDEKKPPDPNALGDSYQGDADQDGKLSYFEAHPEWYALQQGRRIPGIQGGGGTNYCTSNPDATTEFMKNFVQAIVDGPCEEADIVRMWTLDYGKWCQCPNCLALGTPTDRNLLLVHRLDREIKRARAEGRITRPVQVAFLAYADVVEPPSRPLPPDFDYQTCAATFFPINRSYVHNIDALGSPENATYVEQLRGWLVQPDRHYRGQICIGEYYNVSGFKSLPICYMHTMANDIPFYYGLGARHFHYMHCTTRDWGNKSLTNYQMARQLWDAKTDCEALWQDFFAKRYGPAAEIMRGFYESLEPMFSNARPLKYGLARRLARGSRDLFPDARLRYRREPGRECTGPTFAEILASGQKCREWIDRALSAELPQRVRQRIAEDERLFAYGERTVLYYDACASAYNAAWSGRVEEGRLFLQEAQRLAGLLRQDTRSTSTASSHANAENALAASGAAEALVRLEELLGPAVPQGIKCLDPAGPALVLAGREFSGGGGPKYGQRQGGWELFVVPGKRKVSEQGNHVYAKPTDLYSRVSGWFRLNELPTGPLQLTLFGLSRPIKDEDLIPAEVFVNDTSVYRGSCRFSIEGLSPHQLVIPLDALTKGDNRILIQNLAPEGLLGHRPWFGIDRAELRAWAEDPSVTQETSCP